MQQQATAGAAQVLPLLPGVCVHIAKHQPCFTELYALSDLHVSLGRMVLLQE